MNTPTFSPPTTSVDVSTKVDTSTYINTPLGAATVGPAALPQLAGDDSSGRVLRVGQNIVTLRLLASETGGAYSMVEQIVQPGDGAPLHIHRDSDELVYVLASEFDFQCGANHYRITPGGFIFLPRDRQHSFRNSQRLLGKLLVVISPGGMERFWTEMAAEMTDVTPGKCLCPLELNELYHRHGMALLTSLPRG